MLKAIRIELARRRAIATGKRALAYRSERNWLVGVQLAYNRHADLAARRYSQLLESK